MNTQKQMNGNRQMAAHTSGNPEASEVAYKMLRRGYPDAQISLMLTELLGVSKARAIQTVTELKVTVAIG